MNSAVSRKNSTRVLLPAAVLLLAAACVVPRVEYDREVERASRLERTLQARERELAELERKFRELSANLEHSALEREAFDAERIQLMEELEDQREVLEHASRDLEAERRARRKQESEIVDVRGSYGRLVEQLEAEVAAGQITILNLEGRLQVRALDQILFPVGSTEIRAEGEEVLGKVARELVKIPGNQIVIEGHTDDLPIARACFPSNWELSCARASAVVRFLVEQGIPPERISARGFGPYNPISENADSTGRARNRRIEVVLVPESLPPSE